jgi:hypothetical protein
MTSNNITIKVAIPSNSLRLVSIPVNPVNSDFSLQNVLGARMPFYLEGNNKTYLPEWGLNDIEMNLTSGFKIFNKDTLTLAFIGQALNGGKSVSLPSSAITTIGFPYSYQHTAQEVFGQTTSIKYADDGQGNVYMPEIGITNMTMYPGRGYKVYSSTAISEFTFPVLTNSGAAKINENSTYIVTGKSFKFDKTGEMYAVVVDKINDETGVIKQGAEIAAFDGDVCVGSSVYNSDSKTVIIAWLGDEKLSITGAKKNNSISFKIKNNSSDQKEFVVSSSFSQGGKFGESAYSVATLNIVSDKPAKYELLQNYPDKSEHDGWYS